MFKSIPGNNQYIISLSQEIRTIDGLSSNLPIENDKINITLFNRNVNVSIKWLSLIAHYEVILQEEFIDDFFNISFQSINPNPTRSASGQTMVFKKPLSIKYENSIYRVIPNFVKYAIDKNGKLIDIESKKVINFTTNLKRHNVIDNYPSVYIYNAEKGFYKYIYLHRLVALAWCNNSNFVIRPVVNHKDGNKQNYHYSNLEWCSYKENSIHAVNTGLREDNIKCKIRNFYTKEITHFESLSQANVYMGLRANRISLLNFNIRKAKLISGKYEIKVENDNTPWFYENKTEKVNPGRYIITVMHQHGKIEYYHDVRDFKSKYELWNCGNITAMVKRLKHKSPEIKVSIFDNYNILPIQAYDVVNKKIVETKTTVAMSKLLSIPEHTIRACLRLGETNVKHNFAFRYKNNKEWNTDFVIHVKPQVRIKATNVKTNEIMYLDSIRQASKIITCDRTAIKNSLINKLLIKNWYLEEIKE